MNNNTLQLILQILEAGAATAGVVLQGNPEAEAIDAAAAALLKIAGNAINAYQQVTGKPMDLSTLQPIAPVE